MKGLTLFKRRNQSQSQALALVQVPSTDLIMSDNEFSRPEPREIELEIEPEKLIEYIQTTKNLGLANEPLAREGLLHLLKTQKIRIYDHSKIDGFMQRYIYYAAKNLNLGNDIWWQWQNLKEYRHPLPHRVAKVIKSIYESGQNPIFLVSDIVSVTSRAYNMDKNTDRLIRGWKTIPMKRKTEICFLVVKSSADTFVEEQLVIDAWRGPTFSDEEAKI